MAAKTLKRRAIRRTRPDSERFLSVMVVLSHRTFSWSLAKRTLLWAAGIIVGVWALAMIGSAYGFWATKKIMSFNTLQQETQRQQQQLKESLNQAHALEGELQDIRTKLSELMGALSPKAGPDLPPAPNQGPGQAPAPPPDGSRISQLKLDLDRTAALAQVVKARMDPVIQRWNHTPAIQPTAGYLSSGFGFRISPFARRGETTDGLVGYHTGLDICNAEGTPIQATANGTVTFAGWDGRYGQMVVVEHAPHLETWYAHMSLMAVRAGQKVQRGDILGGMGRTGSATGVHLHYEVRLQGKPVNPTPYLRLQKQWLSSLR